MIENILAMGVDEVSFSVFSSNPELRRKWMRDKTPETSLKAVEIFCENIEVNASTVVIPQVTGQEELFRTASTLEEWGVKSFTLARFANFQNQGNILNKRHIIDGIIPHSYEEFQYLVRELQDEFNFRIIGFPASDPENDIPYILSKSKNTLYLKKLPQISSESNHNNQ